ncbi:hypothetical protein [Streptomyces adonidis]|uniref:hypothetical protein n=1 Tax=Streptomyces adonidis TaxID=3231367 RepID=UPI0034DB5D32
MLTWRDIPEGTQWPELDTVVLLSRALRPGTDLSRLSRFRDDRWDINPAIFEDHARSNVLNFDLVPAQLRLAAKYYVWQLLNHTEHRAVRGAKSARVAVPTIARLFTNALQFVLAWLAEQGITAFCQVTLDHLESYLDALKDGDDTLDRQYRCIIEVRRLWAYRDVLPTVLRLPEPPPWGGEDTAELLGRSRKDRENRTRRIGEPTMQMLLSWAIRFLEDFSEDILTAHAEHRELHSRTPEGRRLAGTQAGPGNVRHVRGELRNRAEAYVKRLRQRGEALPGTRSENERLEIRWRHVAAILDAAVGLKDTGTGRLIAESGLPISEHTYLDAPITGTLDGQPWRRERIRYEEAPALARLLSTACLIVIAYLSGARVGEVLNLRRGCIRHDKKTGLWLLDGIYFKGAEDKDGNKIPEGRIREDPWVVVELVARAVALLELLHPHRLLFPRAIEPYLRRDQNLKRSGEARSDWSTSEDLKAFTTWVNTTCVALGRTDVIPDDGRGPLAASRFRRTLAWFIRRRPRGLIAASIQYGHAHTRMLQGYAGSYESGFPDEYAFEDWLYRLECLAEDEQALTEGEHVSGLSADVYRQRVHGANRQFAGRVLTSERQASDLLGNPLLQIHHGEGMTCVLNPTTAACQLRGAADDPMVTPDTDDCRPNCPCLVRTDRDILHVKGKAAELEVIVSDPLAPPIRHARERHELARLKAIITAHEQGGTAS